ncbi:hypothetical protein SUS17_2477 [Sphingomonas sp. S17]|nr:hypothetical protein SUS17_2477 [Sphingomonas sp. S17]
MPGNPLSTGQDAAFDFAQAERMWESGLSEAAFPALGRLTASGDPHDRDPRRPP